MCTGRQIWSDSPHENKRLKMPIGKHNHADPTALTYFQCDVYTESHYEVIHVSLINWKLSIYSI